MDPELILHDVLSILKSMRIDIYRLNMSGIRRIIQNYLDINPSTTHTRAIIQITKYLSYEYGQTLRIKPPSKSVSANISILGSSNPYTIAKLINPANLHKKAYVALDGMKGMLSHDKKKITWSINDIRSDTTQVKNKFRDIVAVKLLSSIVTLSLPVATSTTITTILIDELASQSFISKDRNFHFLAYDKLTTAEINRISNIIHSMDNPTLRKLILDHSCRDGIYTFDPPITVLNTITMSFARPAYVSTIADQVPLTSCLINLEITYLDSAYDV